MIVKFKYLCNILEENSFSCKVVIAILYGVQFRM